MHLTKVDLHGFKSFADKVSFDFDKGITAVLGPNGCGKSNVVDAVKWVLGETSAKNLRGTEMLDVIFAGSERRKPMGMAEVNLYFNNEDGSLPVEYNEVCITRRLYRSGESEYMINKQPCRKRDITELFLDTGIGRSAYSFIEQGKVEALLQAKPAERRAVFEEAAGISKYKQRRKEILSRLDRTNQYLLRVNDIVEEVDKNIRRVSRQASAAKRFQQMTADLKEMKTVHYVRGFRSQSQKLTEVEQQMQELNGLLSREAAAQAELNSRIAELTSQETTLSEQLASYEQSVQGVQDELNKVQVELSAARERMSSIEREGADVGERIELLSKRLEELTAEEAGLTKDLEEKQKALEELTATLSAQDGERGNLFAKLQESEKNVEQIRSELQTIAEERSKLLSEEARAETEATVAQNRAQEFAQKKEALVAQKETLQAQAETLGHTSEQAKTVAEEAEKQLVETREREKAQRAEMERRTEQFSNLNAKRSGLESRLLTLKDLEKSFAGAFAGVQAVMKAHQGGESLCRDIRGMAADLMSVPSEYATAIETALGAQTQDVIVSSARGAQDCIEYLKRNRAGRATFLPMDRIQPRRRLPLDVANLPGAHGEAVDLIEFDETYRSVMEYLLAGVLIAENIDTARELSREKARGVRIVTLDGEVISPHGAMTGGQGKNTGPGIIARKSEMEDLEQQLTQLQKDLEAAIDYRTKAAEGAKAAAESIQELESKRAQTQRDAQAAERDHSIIQSQLNRLVQEEDALSQESAKAESDLGGLTQRQTDFSMKKEELSKRDADTRLRLEDYLRQQQDARTQLDAMSESFAGLREKRAEFQSQVDEATRRLQAIGRDKSEREQELENRVSFKDRSGNEMESLTERRKTLEDREAELLAAREQVREGGVTLREKTTAIRERLQEARDSERATQRRLNEINEAQGQLKLDANETHLRMQQIEEKAREELEITDLPDRAEKLAEQEEELRLRLEASAAHNRSDEMSEDGEKIDPDEEQDHVAKELTLDGNPAPYMTDEQLVETIANLTRKIQNLGPVNMYAIEELTELEARAEFLKSEQDDIQTAANDLHSVIERLNQECYRRFEDTFNMVRDNFQELFTALFGGGKADLVLEKVVDGGDALDAGIDIIARPPGKEPKNISLLSGGEKALCAVALLFALFRSKPSPFCILDEVDGPLDESNIDRFMKAVRSFAEETQFILISHSKRTMSMTDTIYGVTQKESGVSTKYSLRFTNSFDEKKKQNTEAPAIAG